MTNTILHKAVTLDGTVIHRSGLITGGHSTNQAATRWQESDIEGRFHCNWDTDQVN